VPFVPLWEIKTKIPLCASFCLCVFVANKKSICANQLNLGAENKAKKSVQIRKNCLPVGKVCELKKNQLYLYITKHNNVTHLAKLYK
jgi:hypothetical protein